MRLDDFEHITGRLCDSMNGGKNAGRLHAAIKSGWLHENTDLQRDALLAAGVDENHIYEDFASGKRSPPELTKQFESVTQERYVGGLETRPIRS